MFKGSNDYINNFLQPFMADGQAYTHDEFLMLLNSTLDHQLKVIKFKSVVNYPL